MEPEKTIPQTPPVQSSNFAPTSVPPSIPLSSHLPEIQPKPPKGEGFKSLLSTIGILIAAPIIAVLLTTFVFQSYEVDGPSMETTLDNHDRLLVFKLPRTIANLTNKDYIPKRGEIVIFKTSAIHDGGADDGSEKQLIKRVVGLPGDRVIVSNGIITVYNTEFPEGFNPDVAGGYSDIIGTTSGNVDVVVREGEVFVCGDNRSNSLDSRAIGAIPSEDIIGKLSFRIYPLSNAQKF